MELKDMYGSDVKVESKGGIIILGIEDEQDGSIIHLFFTREQSRDLRNAMSEAEGEAFLYMKKHGEPEDPMGF